MAGSDAVRDEPRPSLRERRRLETTAEISSAALNLFESQGVDSTTVADIAGAAGVSQRTFFRYFDSKEAAAYVEEPGYVAVIEEWAADPEPVDDPVEALMEVLQRAAKAMAGDQATSRQLRVMRLERSHPGLRVGRYVPESQHHARLESALRRRSGHRYSEYELATMIRVASALVESSVREWLARMDAGEPADLHAIFAHNREVIGLAMHRNR